MNSHVESVVQVVLVYSQNVTRLQHCLILTIFITSKKSNLVLVSSLSSISPSPASGNHPSTFTSIDVPILEIHVNCYAIVAFLLTAFLTGILFSKVIPDVACIH